MRYLYVYPTHARATAKFNEKVREFELDGQGHVDRVRLFNREIFMKNGNILRYVSAFSLTPNFRGVQFDHVFVDEAGSLTDEQMEIARSIQKPRVIP